MQIPNIVLGRVEGAEDVEEGVVVVVVVVVRPPQDLLPSPRTAKAALFWMRTAALFDTPATPVGVPVVGNMMAGLE